MRPGDRILSAWLTGKPAEVQAQKAAMEYYDNYFESENLGSVTEEGFKEFLLLKNDKHWSGIHRSSPSSRAERCRETLAAAAYCWRGCQRTFSLIPSR
jgi:hypothetical protein